MASLDNLLGDLEQLAIAAAPKDDVEEEKATQPRGPAPRLVVRTDPTTVKKKKQPVKKDLDEEDDAPQENLDDLISQISALAPPKEEEKKKEEVKKPATKPVLTKPSVSVTTTTTTTPSSKPSSKPALTRPNVTTTAPPSSKPALTRPNVTTSAPKAPVYTPPPPKVIGTCGACRKNVLDSDASLDIKGQKYHKACFKCADCGAPLQSYHPHGGKFYCMSCIKKKQGNAATVSSGKCCAICGGPIDAFTLQAGDKYYHKDCFKCAHCGKAIAGTYGEVGGKIYCSNECIREATGTRCNGCGKVITGQYINVLNKPYHRECLACKVCKKPFPDLKFYNVNDEPYCADCATKALSH